VVGKISGVRHERWPNLDDVRQPSNGIAFPSTLKLLRTFGTSKDIVVKKKIFEYSLDKRLSWRFSRGNQAFRTDSAAGGPTRRSFVRR